MILEPDGVAHTEALDPDPTVSGVLGHQFFRLRSPGEARLILPTPGHRVRVEVDAAVGIHVGGDGPGARVLLPRVEGTWAARDVYDIEIVSGDGGVELSQALSPTAATDPRSSVFVASAAGTPVVFHQMSIYRPPGTHCSCPRAITPAQACETCAGAPS